MSVLNTTHAKYRRSLVLFFFFGFVFCFFGGFFVCLLGGFVVGWGVFCFFFFGWVRARRRAGTGDGEVRKKAVKSVPIKGVRARF